MISSALVVAAASCSDEDPDTASSVVEIAPSAYEVQDVATTSSVPVDTTPTADGRSPVEQAYTVKQGDFPVVIADLYDIDLSRLEPRDAVVEAVRRLDPAYFNPDAMVLMGNFAGEVIHTPELLEMLRKHAVEPRVTLLEYVLSELQARGAVSDSIDKHTIATMCFGSYFGAFYRGDRREEIPENVVAVLWPVIAP